MRGLGIRWKKLFGAGRREKRTVQQTIFKYDRCQQDKHLLVWIASKKNLCLEIQKCARCAQPTNRTRFAHKWSNQPLNLSEYKTSEQGCFVRQACIRCAATRILEVQQWMPEESVM